jgi:hypothetical protein
MSKPETSLVGYRDLVMQWDLHLKTTIHGTYGRCDTFQSKFKL